MSAVWKDFNLESESSLMATCNICKTTVSRGGYKIVAFNTTHLIWHIKNKNKNEFTQAVQANTLKQQTLADTFKRKYPSRYIKIATGPKILHILLFLNPRYALSSRHYITLTPLSSYNVPVSTLVTWISYS